MDVLAGPSRAVASAIGNIPVYMNFTGTMTMTMNHLHVHLASGQILVYTMQLTLVFRSQ